MARRLQHTLALGFLTALMSSGCKKPPSPPPPPSEPVMQAKVQAGEVLWVRACTHALGVFSELTGAPAGKTTRGRRACINGLRKAAPAQANRAARCFLKMRQMQDMVPCMKILFPDGKMPAHGRRAPR